MSEIVSVILEILKYTIPSGIVFVTAYFLLKTFLEEQRQVALIQASANAKNVVGPSSGVISTRLQAF